MLRRPLLLALGAGLISATGFAPLDLWPVALACLALLLWLVHQAPSLKSALLRGWLFGVGHFTVGNNWIQHAFDYQDKMPPVLGYFAVLLLAIYLAIYPAIAAGLAWRFSRWGSGRRPFEGGYVLAFAAAWIVTEYLRASLFTGYAWNPLGVIWVPTLLARSASWMGTYALSGLTVLVAGLFVLALHRRWRFSAAGSVAVVALGAAGVLDLRLELDKANERPPLVRVVQPNIGQEGVSDPLYAEKVMRALLRLSGTPGNEPRLLVWPEGMVNYYVEDGYPPQWYGGAPAPMTRARIAALLGPQDRALVSGNALFFDSAGKLGGAGNSVFVVDSAAQLGKQRYDKAHLVPYGEYLPMRTILQPLGLSRLVMGDVDFIPGPGPRSIEVPGFGKAGVQVCYEIIFSGQVVDRANRPDFIFNPSNDAWFGSWGPPQHLAQARMRAIEEGLPILRATPTGISAVIDADGALLGTVPLGEEGVIEVPLPEPAPPTLFARLGNWLAFITAATFLIIAIAIRRFSR